MQEWSQEKPQGRGGRKLAVVGKRTGSFNFFWRSALLAISLLSTAPAFAQDATWLASPTVAGPVAATFDFNANANWTPTTAPGSVTQTGTATFGASNGTNISFSAGITTLSGFTFTAAASNYAFFNTNTFVQFVGAGIVINGGGATFTNSGTTGAGGLVFLNSSTAGSATITNNANGATAFDGTSAAGSASITNTNGGITQFSSTSMAGSATIANNNGRTSFLDTSTADSAGITNSAGGATQFLFSSNARNATITNNSFGTTEFLFTSIGGHATITNNANGITQFGLSGGTDTATAGNAIITNNPGGSTGFFASTTAGSATIINSGGNNAVIEFNNNSKAGSARITNNDELTFADNSTAGSAAIANSHGEISFIGSSTAGSATITNNGLIFFENTSTGGTARLINGPNGDIDLSNLSSTGMSAGSIEGAGFITLGSKNLTVGGNNLSTTFSGLIGDGGLFGGTGGSLTKVGTGMLTLSGSNLYTGATIVNGGTLEVDGSIATSSAVTVNSGGALAGLGNVSATTINSGGTLAPGNAANPTGTLAITGNLAFASGALYLVQLSGANASKASVTGTATLNGATVNAIFAPGGSVVKQYTIVTAGSVSGTFNPNLVATNLPPGFSASLSYSATDVFLTLAAAQLGKGGGSNGNQQAVTNAITNFFNAGGALPAGFVNLFALSGAPLANALTQLSGETATGSQQTTFDAMGQFMGLLTDPFMGRGGGLNGSASPLGYAEGEASAYASSSGRKTDAFAMFTKAPPAAYEPRWSVWAAGFGGSQTTDGNAVVGSNTATAASPARRSAPIISSRRSRSRALRLAAAARISRSPMAGRAVRICSRPALICATPTGLRTSRPHSPMAGRTLPPTAS
jgi:hypothetical protein